MRILACNVIVVDQVVLHDLSMFSVAFTNALVDEEGKQFIRSGKMILKKSLFLHFEVFVSVAPGVALSL